MVQMEIDYKRLKQDLKLYNVEEIVFNNSFCDFIKKNDPDRIEGKYFIFNHKKYPFNIIKTPIPYSVVWGNT